MRTRFVKIAALSVAAMQLIGRLDGDSDTPPAPIAPTEEAPQEPYLHIYEYDSAFGVHREFVPREWNAMNPTRRVALYANPVPRETDALTVAAHDVLAERQRQIAAEGWTPEHDDGHANDELSLAAACYALHGVGPYTGLGIDVKRTWPLTGWDWSWWKPKDRRRNLVKAGALILAEIERIDRKATS